MKQKVFSLVLSLVAIVLGITLSVLTNRIFYVLVLAGVLFGIYDLYLIATHKKTVEKQQETQRRLGEQSTFDTTVAPSAPSEAEVVVVAPGEAGFATITVNWFKEKMGAGSMPVVINGEAAGVIKKGSEQVVYRTNVPFNVVQMGIYRAEIELSPGDTVAYYIAGNGIRHDRTVITRRPG
ncbi:MAG: hypothetical protein FWC48_04425 [Actinomycetia bacterium]|nr:hypothetical protein [Actinomycetes bacterium]